MHYGSAPGEGDPWFAKRFVHVTWPRDMIESTMLRDLQFGRYSVRRRPGVHGYRAPYTHPSQRRDDGLSVADVGLSTPDR